MRNQVNGFTRRNDVSHCVKTQENSLEIFSKIVDETSVSPKYHENSTLQLSKTTYYVSEEDSEYCLPKMNNDHEGYDQQSQLYICDNKCSK